MLSAILNAFRVPDLRNKILFTIAIIGVYRFGSFLPVPGVDLEALEELAGQAGGIVGLLNLFSGGGLAQMAVFGLGIMPYITASIIMQLLTVVIPKIEQWQKEGETGTKKITQWTRYMTVGLAILQSTGLVFLAHRGFPTGIQGGDQGVQLITAENFTPAKIALIVLTFTAGTAMVMWFGELITQRGVGNGMSILIFAAIIAGLPSQGNIIIRQLGWTWFSVIAVLGIGVLVAIVIVEQGQRRIPVQYAKRVVGRKMYGGTSTYIPLKVNQAGVIPIIFASSVLYFPQLMATVVPWEGVRTFISDHMTNPASLVYIVLYATMIVFFAFFYTAITFNPLDVADNMKKFGGFIPGIRAGRATAEHLNFILTRITLPGSLFLAAVAVLPSVALALLNVSALPFGGVSILISVGVALETMKQIESQLMERHYEGFLT